MFKKLLDRGEAGDNIGCLLRGVKRDEISRGQVSRNFSEKKLHPERCYLYAWVGGVVLGTVVHIARALTLTIANS